MIFQDKDDFNDYIGPTGEVQDVEGGQGGGAGGSRSENYYCGTWCDVDEDDKNDKVCNDEWRGKFAGAISDARGGSGGGGGGAITIQSLGALVIGSESTILAKGGKGGGGETTGQSNWGGPSGGGSGGAVVLQSAESIGVLSGALIDVRGGLGKSHGANGGAGIVQLQLPPGERANVAKDTIEPSTSWVDPTNAFNPALFTPFSAAVSHWYDMGRTLIRPPDETNPVFRFTGLDNRGFVITDEEGNVIDPENSDIECDYLGQLDPFKPGHYRDGEEPRADFIPPNASVQVLFQGADAITEGSKEIDPRSLTHWSPSAGVANNHQFIRYRVRFDLAKDGGQPGPLSPRPSVQSLEIHSEF